MGVCPLILCLPQNPTFLCLQGIHPFISFQLLIFLFFYIIDKSLISYVSYNSSSSHGYLHSNSKKDIHIMNIHECINWQNQLDYINWFTIHWIIFNYLEMYTIVSLYDSNIVLLSRKVNVFIVSSMQTDSVSIDFIDESVFTFINEESCLSVVWECTQMVLSSLQGLLSQKVQWKLMVVWEYLAILQGIGIIINCREMRADYHQYDWTKWTLMDKMVLIVIIGMPQLILI